MEELDCAVEELDCTEIELDLTEVEVGHIVVEDEGDQVTPSSLP